MVFGNKPIFNVLDIFFLWLKYIEFENADVRNRQKGIDMAEKQRINNVADVHAQVQRAIAVGLVASSKQNVYGTQWEYWFKDGSCLMYYEDDAGAFARVSVVWHEVVPPHMLLMLPKTVALSLLRGHLARDDINALLGFFKYCFEDLPEAQYQKHIAPYHQALAEWFESFCSDT